MFFNSPTQVLIFIQLPSSVPYFQVDIMRKMNERLIWGQSEPPKYHNYQAGLHLSPTHPSFLLMSASVGQADKAIGPRFNT